MEILFLTVQQSDTCAFYRSSGVVPDLRTKTKHNITLTQMDRVNLDWSFITQFDLVMIQRGFTKEVLNLCGYIKHCNIKLWVDYDDHLFAVNPENPTYQLYASPDIQANIKGILKLADVVTVPTEYLRQAYIEFNKNIVVVPNALNDLLFKRAELVPRTNHCIWRGPPAHIYDLMSHADQINHIIKEFDQWRFVFMGFSPWFLAETTNKFNIPVMDIVIYFKTFVDLAPSCMHVPLADNAFNRTKSNIAAIEGTYAGAVCVVPAWWNFPGTIPYNNPDEYYEGIRSVLSGEVDKAAMSRIAWEYVQDCLLLSKVNVERLQVINSLLC
jgi:hypothetical protein